MKFVAKLGVSGKHEKDSSKKYHIMILRQYIDQIEKADLEGKQVKIALEDEL